MWKLRPIREQVEAVAKEFDIPTEKTLEFLDTAFQKTVLPPEALGWVAIATIEAVAERHFPDSKDPVENYRRATELALDKISQRFGEFGNLDCKSTPDKFYLPEKTRCALEIIGIHQTGSILVVPARFNVRTDPNVASRDEFPLGSFFTTCLGLTHPERYSPTKPAVVNENTIECIGFGKVKCQTCWFDDARAKWSQATGFIPEHKEDLP